MFCPDILKAAALEVDAKERVENERAEKRLKEKLAAAKRPSRMASPAVASAPSETDVKTLPGVEDITMDMETAPLPSAESVPEVCPFSLSQAHPDSLISLPGSLNWNDYLAMFR